MRDHDLSGIYPAILTPLTSKGEISTEVAQALLKRLLNAGVDGVYVAGSTGEGMRLSVHHRQTLLDCLLSVLPPGKKLIVHVGAENIVNAKQLAAHAANSGAHAISSLPPQGSFVEVRDYYRRLAEYSELPLIVYYFPEVCPGAFQHPAEIHEVCALPNVAGVKFTDYNLFLLSQLNDRNQLVYNGRDEVLAAGLLMGARGGIGSTYNLIPEMYVSLYRLAQQGEWEQARELQRLINRIVAVLVKYPFLPALKAAMAQSGLECGNTLDGQRFESAGQRQAFLEELARVLPPQDAWWLGRAQAVKNAAQP